MRITGGSVAEAFSPTWTRPAEIAGGRRPTAVLQSPRRSVGERYRATVTREEDNLYRVDLSDVYIKTRYCYVYCYYEDAIIDTGEMVIYFLDSDDECTIDKILVER
jgi:hypothetical protein